MPEIVAPAFTNAIALLLVSFLLLPAPTAAILIPTDYLALQSIRKSLYDLPGSFYFASWDFTADPCTFPGVLCRNDRVVALALGDPRAGSPGLSGQLSPALGRLPALAELSLVPGRVSGAIPSSISLCSSLRFLALSRNMLSGTIPPSIASLAHLRVIDIGYNFLSGTIPPLLTRLPSLSTLILSGNRLTGPIPTFAPNSPLVRLDLQRNRLSGPIPVSLPTSLHYLSLSFNQLSGRIDHILPSLRRLTFLDLSSNSFSGPIPGSIFTLPISSLRLQRNYFSGDLHPSVPVRIPYIDLSFNRLGGRVPAALSDAEWLYLDYNRFIGEVPTVFVDRILKGEMRLLYLQHNFLTGMAIGPPSNVPMITSLCLQYNCMVPPVQTACPARAGLQKTRPAEQCPKWGKV
ncbi:probably inactive leucine-rich repeat receptor-like protein kinase IMK2 [Phalaenopsis equestris]|uniref:probably inactive leucine-rich repeat receptor-like protein kinase IMK2 n=1 Tax=Phalaenopsis equestris TaxID=78828 RepID=UPI0009E232AD|nr:probably inactive leucine-rich repeat receptor-like protein kinase IMK2 [Phalaenopsis equestris]